MLEELLAKAKAAKVDAAVLTEEKKNEALRLMAKSLLDHTDDILAANAVDMKNAKGVLSAPLMDRLMLNEKRITAMADGLTQVASLPDPTGKLLESHTREDGLQINKVSVPIGVIAIIYESRPNVTADAAALALKSGNVCILRTGKDAYHSACAIVDALREGLSICGINEDLINLVHDTTRDGATALMTANGYVDLLIPRGGAGLINSCVKNATVPVIATGTGICHIYVEKTADLEKAVRIIENAKTSRPGVCNAEEVLLVDRAIAGKFLPMVKKRLVHDRIAAGKQPVELRLDDAAQAVIDGTPAGEKDFDTEFLDYILAVKLVNGVEEAVSHISAHSTGHSEAILTQDEAAANYFTSRIDSAAVYVNASTRFTDGGEFGYGCEMGISTQKMHARGPMGLKELTTYKYIVRGNGHIR